MLWPQALDAIPALEYDSDKGEEDVLKTDHLYDDVGDELRYGLPTCCGKLQNLRSDRPQVRNWTRQDPK